MHRARVNSQRRRQRAPPPVARSADTRRRPPLASRRAVQPASRWSKAAMGHRTAGAVPEPSAIATPVARTGQRAATGPAHDRKPERWSCDADRSARKTRHHHGGFATEQQPRRPVARPGRRDASPPTGTDGNAWATRTRFGRLRSPGAWLGGPDGPMRAGSAKPSGSVAVRAAGPVRPSRWVTEPGHAPHHGGDRAGRSAGRAGRGEAVAAIDPRRPPTAADPAAGPRSSPAQQGQWTGRSAVFGRSVRSPWNASPIAYVVPSASSTSAVSGVGAAVDRTTRTAAGAARGRQRGGRSRPCARAVGRLPGHRAGQRLAQFARRSRRFPVATDPHGHEQAPGTGRRRTHEHLPSTRAGSSAVGEPNEIGRQRDR